ncbi:hypothetical protein CHCC20441_2205 [Bacillus licheniformis]|nr:hypothetical protein SC10_B2orf05338 [Bacillus paralicheniformis]KYC73410.1 hypothetical protein B4092_3711 [Bacillus licheniformis]TWN10651.1 hypothetical protein CHCC14564_3203 [Bacillus licheniformis LMG 17339]KYC80406.1 hypothetical protein B4090_3743 [Bacillus licheniformis]KYC84527.1 hypothetical protein B4091_3857 [Bacillus licheniformis]
MMKEIDDMIRRLRSRGIKVDKVKYPKHVLCEKKWMKKPKNTVKPSYRDFNGYSFI